MLARQALDVMYFELKRTLVGHFTCIKLIHFF
jgi:hypothetical protein